MSSLRPYATIIRKKTRLVTVGTVSVGGDSPISVQTMTNTLTTDVAGTLAQIERAVAVGADIVRVSCPDEDSTRALKDIVRHSSVPIVADIHFHYRRAIEAAEAGAACLRINPGNIGNRQKIAEVVKAAKDHNCSIRIGVNAGSLEKHLLEKYGEPCPEAMVESALFHTRILEDQDFFNIKISAKASGIFLSVAAYRALSAVSDYPLHLGITEAGGLLGGTVKSAIGIGQLLAEGIGDTIRVSLSADPVEEVKVGYEILKSLDLRCRGVRIISCPSCARQGFDVVSVVASLEERLAHIVEPVTLSIIGCVVNGPGEARETQVGVVGGGADSIMIYIDGASDHKIKSAIMLDHIVELVEQKVETMCQKNQKG